MTSPQPVLRPKSETTKSSRWWIWLILLIVAGAAAYKWYPQLIQVTSAKSPDAKKSGKGDAGRPVPVIAAMTRKGDMPVYLDGLGSVTAFNTVTVKTRVDGQIDKVAFTEGQFVKQGDLLIEIDPRPYQVMLEQAEAGLAGHQAQLANAKVDLERYKVLYAQEAVPKQQLDTQEALVNQIASSIKG